MTNVMLERGNAQIVSCYAKCDACETVAKGYQFHGPHGYATFCYDCIGGLLRNTKIFMAPDG